MLSAPEPLDQAASTFSIQDGEKSSIQLDASCFLKLAARLDRACEGFDFPSSVGSGSPSASSVSPSRIGFEEIGSVIKVPKVG